MFELNMSVDKVIKKEMRTARGKTYAVFLFFMKKNVVKKFSFAREYYILFKMPGI